MIRQKKFGRLIQKELSGIFQRDKQGFLQNTFVTITEVCMSPDLQIAKVYISMTLISHKEALVEKINEHKSEIRKALGYKIRKQVRVIPQLAFFIDEVEEKAQRLDELIKNLTIPPADNEEDKKIHS